MTIHSVFEDKVSPSLFEGINARYYRAAEVAKSFVSNEQFENLIVRQHSIVVGPRGSGKTTLLRMLHPECLRVWNDEAAEDYRAKIDFSAAYVATDRVWREQVESAIGPSCQAQDARIFSQVIALDVMAAMSRTIELRLTKDSGTGGAFRYVELSERAKASLVQELSRGWGLDPTFLDLGSLRVAIRRRRIELRSKFLEGSFPGVNGEPALWLEWHEAALLAIEAFESITGIQKELWAILFDELEIVPAAVRDTILSATRGLDPRLLIKCSLSPWLEEHALMVAENDGTVFHDFNVLKLFYGRRTEGYEFSRKLIEYRLKSAGFQMPEGVPIEDMVFGVSKFSGDESDGMTNRTAAAYGDEKPLGNVVKELADKDDAFVAWLKAQKIDPNRLSNISEKRRAQTLRKARNIMIARLEFRRSTGLLRSRKTVAMYTGGCTMLDICEGNPRLLLGLLLPLLEYFDGKHSIPHRLQAEAVNQIAGDFYALIDAIPVTEDVQEVPELGRRKSALRRPYMEFIDRVAHYFHDRTLRGGFDPQPPTSFRIPRTCSSSLKAVVGRLVNLGAAVLITDRGIKDVLVGDFDQHRLRLCYLIAAREHLPPNLDRPISLLKILGESSVSQTEQLPGLELKDE